jgi:DNA repair photolyase
MQSCQILAKENRLSKTSIIYEPRGKAREYCELAANLYRGCSHHCAYCYAPATLYMTKEDFFKPKVRADILYKFEKDAITLNSLGETRPILLSFTTDPYQPIDVREQITRKAIKILHRNHLKVSILTKGGKRSERDFDLLSSHPELSEYGATLVFTDESNRKEIESGAAPTKERIDSLKKAHDMGIPTYVSLEPVWIPAQTLELIDLTKDIVDFYKVGKLNYNIQEKSINWKEFKNNAIERLGNYSKRYYIKKDLQKY